MASEERTSRINPEKTEMDEVLEKIIGRIEAAEEELLRNEETGSKDVGREKEAAENTQKRALYSL